MTNRSISVQDKYNITSYRRCLSSTMKFQHLRMVPNSHDVKNSWWWQMYWWFHCSLSLWRWVYFRWLFKTSLRSLFATSTPILFAHIRVEDCVVRSFEHLNYHLSRVRMFSIYFGYPHSRRDPLRDSRTIAPPHILSIHEYDAHVET